MRLLLKVATRFLYARRLSELSSIPYPSDAPQAHGSGLDPDRVLLIGTGPLVGRGVVSHQIALPGRLAIELSQMTGRGVDADVVINNRCGISALNDALGRLDLRKYDAIVVTPGAADAFELTRPERWADKVTGLLDRILDESAPSTVVVIAGVHPATAPGQHAPIRSLVDGHARMLNSIAQRICGQTDRTRFVPLYSSMHLLGPNRTSKIYFEWAHHIAGSLAPSLSATVSQPDSASGTPRSLRAQPQPVAERRRALADLGVAETGPEERFDRVVALARAYFDTHFAAFVLTDGHNISYKSKDGFRDTPRIAKLISATIDAAGPLAIASAESDQRYRSSTVATYASVGFYLGHPIESPAGYRVGVLCVFDLNPRAPRAADDIMLRDLAMMLQRELWPQEEVLEDV